MSVHYHDMVCTVQEEECQQEEKDTTSSENSTDIVDLASSPEPEKIGKILRVVLTGGPNGGKITATQVIPALLRPDSDLNFPKVLTIPETPTLIMEMGVNRTEELGLNDKKLLAFQVWCIPLGPGRTLSLRLGPEAATGPTRGRPPRDDGR